MAVTLWTELYEKRRFGCIIFIHPEDRRDPLRRMYSLTYLEQDSYIGLLRHRRFIKYKYPRWEWADGELNDRSALLRALGLEREALPPDQTTAHLQSPD